MKAKLLAFSLLCSSVAMAQVAWQTEIEMSSPAELNYEGNLIYTWHYKPNTYYEYNLTVYNNQMKELNTISYKNKKLAKLIGAQAVGNSVFFYILGGKEATLMKVDAKGEKVKEISFEDSESDIYDLFMRSDGSSLYVGRSIKPKKRGFTIECYDEALSKKWNYDLVPDKGSNVIKAMDLTPRGVLIFSSYQKNAFSNYTYSSMAIDHSGKETGNEAVEMPPYLSVQMGKTLSDGSFIVACNYGNGPSSLPDMSSGLVLKKFSATGTLVHTYDLASAEIANEIMPMESARPFGDVPPALHPIDIVEKDGETTLICESYYFEKIAIAGSSGAAGTTPSKEGHYFMLDLISVKLGNNDYEISKTAKPYQVIKFENIMAISDGELYNQISNCRAYTYQFSHNGVYYTQGWLRNFYYYNATTLDGSYVNVDERVFYGRPYFGAINVRGINGKVVRKPDFSDSKALSFNGLMKFDNHFVVYQYRLGVLKAATVNL